MTGDLGLFGPDSVTWKVHKEPIVSLGGLRSLYLQALHPRAVAGVAQNSSYRSDPWGRLNRTSEYVGTVLYGTTAEVEAAASRLRRLHSRMTATDPRTRARFGLYWLFIRAGSGLIRYDMLRAVARRAEATA